MQMSFGHQNTTIHGKDFFDIERENVTHGMDGLLKIELRRRTSKTTHIESNFAPQWIWTMIRCHERTSLKSSKKTMPPHQVSWFENVFSIERNEFRVSGNQRSNSEERLVVVFLTRFCDAILVFEKLRHPRRQFFNVGNDSPSHPLTKSARVQMNKLSFSSNLVAWSSLIQSRVSTPHR